MAIISITIPDDKVDRIRDAFASEYGWTPELGVTKAAFTKQIIIRFIRQRVKNAEGDLSAQTARTAVNNEIDNIAIT